MRAQRVDLMEELYFLKIGGSVITDLSKPYTAKMEEIRRVLSEIKEAKAKKGFEIIIGHGSGSFAHLPAKEYNVPAGIINEKSRKGATLTYLAAKELNNIFVKEAIDLGIDVFPFSPSSFGIAEESMLSNGIVEHIKTTIERGFIPVTYGDVVIDKKKGVAIASTEEVFRFLAIKMKPSKVFLATDVDGVFDKDPEKNSDARLVNVVDASNINEIIKSTDSSSKRIDVTGGMRNKVMRLYDISKNTGAMCYIFNGTKEGNIRKMLIGELERYTLVKA
ncbi:MAG: isopentenyl phosphate kinase [Candidatus Micrarchaeia archaeon]